MNEDQTFKPPIVYDKKIAAASIADWERRHGKPWQEKQDEVEITKPRLKEIPPANKLEIPAGAPDRTPITIAKKPHYHTVEGLYLRHTTFDIGTGRPAYHKDTIIASYLVEMGSETYFLHFPVYLDRDTDQRYQSDVLNEIAAGKKPAERVTVLSHIQNNVLKRTATNSDALELYHSMRMVIKHPNVILQQKDAMGMLANSGWKQSGTRPLEANVVINPGMKVWQPYEKNFFLNRFKWPTIHIKLYEQLAIGNYESLQIIHKYDPAKENDKALHQRLIEANT